MRFLHLVALRQGAPRFSTGTGWSPLPALSISILIVAISLLSGKILVAAVRSLQPAASPLVGLPAPAATVLFLLAMQATMILLTLTAARWGGGALAGSLALGGSAKGPRAYWEALTGTLVLLSLYSASAYATGFTDLVTDLQPFIMLLRSPVWLLAILAVAVGAPVAEELLFRGFLLPALSRSRLRFWGSAVVSTLGWTSLHAGYSAAGMVEVFLVGLYFCWLLWRSGSLRLPLLCHIATNAVTLVIVAILAWRA